VGDDTMLGGDEGFKNLADLAEAPSVRTVETTRFANILSKGQITCPLDF
jgi:hypothetical protein